MILCWVILFLLAFELDFHGRIGTLTSYFSIVYVPLWMTIGFGKWLYLVFRWHGARFHGCSFFMCSSVPTSMTLVFIRNNDHAWCVLDNSWYASVFRCFFYSRKKNWSIWMRVSVSNIRPLWSESEHSMWACKNLI